MAIHLKKKSTSPCVGVCSTTYGDAVCRGCRRTCLEVIHWNRYAPHQKQAVCARLEKDMVQVVGQFVAIIDVALLQDAWQKVATKAPVYTNPLCFAYELLRLRAEDMTALESYGLSARITVLSPLALFKQLDAKLYRLSLHRLQHQ